MFSCSGVGTTSRSACRPTFATPSSKALEPMAARFPNPGQDGMDRAKFTVPRNTTQAKRYQQLWRPQLHGTGAIIDGIADQFYLVDQDIAKTADLQLTLTCRALEVVHDTLRQRGVALPRMLRIVSDNAASETKTKLS